MPELAALSALPALPGDWAHPGWTLPLALGWALLAGAVLAARRRAGARARALAGPAARAPRGGAGDALLLAALLAAAVALAGPRIGTRTLRLPATGVDVVVLLDVSRSMEVRDVPPSRLDRARRAARGLLERLGPGDRAALAAFAGDGALLSPLTTDAQALAVLLERVDGALMSDRATRPASGLDAAERAFDAESARPKVVLLLTDGEHLAGGAAGAAAERARRAGARVVAVAIGTEAGATVPGRSGPLRDASGEVVVSRRESSGLARLAEATGGRLFEADRWGEVAPAALARAVRREAGDDGEDLVERRVPASRAGAFAGLALALALAEGLAGLRPRGARAAAPARRAAVPAALTAAALLLGAGARPATAAEDEAPSLRERIEAAARTVGGLRGQGMPDPAALARAVREEPRAARPLLRLGLARAERGDWSEAERAFLGAALRAGSPETAALAYYDLGVAALERGALERGRDAFLDALALAPDDERARANLQWTLRALRERPPEREEPGPPRGAERGGEGGEEGGEEGGSPDAEARSRAEARDAEARRRAEAARERAGGDDAAQREGGAEGRASDRSKARSGEGARGRAPGRGEAAPLDAEEVAHWLRAVEDEPGAMLRRAARSEGARESREPAPAW